MDIQSAFAWGAWSKAVRLVPCTEAIA